MNLAVWLGWPGPIDPSALGFLEPEVTSVLPVPIWWLPLNTSPAPRLHRILDLFLGLIAFWSILVIFPNLCLLSQMPQL